LKFYALLLLLLILTPALYSGIASADKQHAILGRKLSQPEVGVVRWGRDFKQALAESNKSGKPVFAFFQEVPGCQGCRDFGSRVMTNPLIVDAVEQEFVPVLIYNNKPGKDRTLLEHYNEPAWNYQVIRFLDASGKDIIPRRDKVWTLPALGARMIAALEKHGQEVPSYLNEFRTRELNHVAFSMYCYWTGEMELGGIKGVYQTETGHFDGSEVTRVWYDPSEILLPSLATKAEAVKCANSVYLDSNAEVKALNDQLKRLTVKRFSESGYHRASASDQKKQIEQSPFLKLGLSQYQLTKVNAFARKDYQRALGYLSPSQRAALSSQ